jgi:hypothetical protein
MQQRQELVMKTFKKKLTILAILTFNASPLMSMNPDETDQMRRSDSYEVILQQLKEALHANDISKIDQIFSEFQHASALAHLLNLALKKNYTLDYDVIKLLLDRGAILNAWDIDHFIVIKNIAFIKFLIDNQITFNYYAGECLSFNPSHPGFGSLISGFDYVMQKAVKYQAFTIVNYLLNNYQLSDKTKNLANLYLKIYNHEPISAEIVKQHLDTNPENASDFLITLLKNNRLDVAELCLQHPEISAGLKNSLISWTEEIQLDAPKLQLLIKYGAEVDEKTLQLAISNDHANLTKLLLDTKAVVPTGQTFKFAINKLQNSEKLVQQLLNAKENISLDTERLLINHPSLIIQAEILSKLTQDLDRIKKATDLTVEQKEILLKAFRQINIVDIIVHEKYDSLKQLPYLNISEKLLLKYFPLGLWTNEQKDRILRRMQIPNTFEAQAQHPSHEQVKNYMSRDPMVKLTLSEQLLINLARISKNVGENAICAGKDPKDASEVKYYGSGFAGDLIKSKILEQVIPVERKFAANGFETFFHGRNWEWNFVNDVYNMVSGLTNGNPDYDTITLRFREKNCDIAKLQDYRKQLITKGADFHIGTGTRWSSKESEVTFMNKTLSSNPLYYGECTGTYFIDNRSIASGEAVWEKIEQIFAQNNLQTFYTQYKSELKNLYQHHKKSSELGEILCIAVKQDAVNQMVYTAHSGGVKGLFSPSTKISLTKLSVLINDRYIDNLRAFYCLAVSDIPGEYGDKYVIKSLNLADPEKYAAYIQARQAFFEKMKAEVATNAAKTGAGNENL